MKLAEVDDCRLELVTLEEVAVAKNADFRLSVSSKEVLAYVFWKLVEQRFIRSSPAMRVLYSALQHQSRMVIINRILLNG